MVRSFERERVASQVENIRLWTITNKHYQDLPDIEASWFIDPPYEGLAGRGYKVNRIDYTELADFCLHRKGQVTVCEMEGASWLPFVPLYTQVTSHSKYLTELIWEKP